MPHCTSPPQSLLQMFGFSPALRSLPHTRCAPGSRRFPAAPTRSLVARAEKKESGRSFASQFKDLTVEELDSEVENCKRALFELRVTRANGGEVKSHLFKYNRRKAAQLLTVKRQKEIEQGIDKRESRKMEIKRLIKLGEMVN